MYDTVSNKEKGAADPLALADDILAIYQQLATLAARGPDFRDEVDDCFAALRALQERHASALREQIRRERNLDPAALDEALDHADELLPAGKLRDLRGLQKDGAGDPPMLASSGIPRRVERRASAIRRGMDLQEKASGAWSSAVTLLAEEHVDVEPILDEAAASITKLREFAANNRRRTVHSEQPDQNRRSVVQPTATLKRRCAVCEDGQGDRTHPCPECGRTYLCMRCKSYIYENAPCRYCGTESADALDTRLRLAIEIAARMQRAILDVVEYKGDKWDRAPHQHKNGNAPGHGHAVPGIWDVSNGAAYGGGSACSWCAAWNTMIASTKEAAAFMSPPKAPDTTPPAATTVEPTTPPAKCATCKGERFIKCEHCSACGCVVCAGSQQVRCPDCKPKKPPQASPNT